MKPATEKQLLYLRRLGVDHPEKLDIRQASDLIRVATRSRRRFQIAIVIVALAIIVLTWIYGIFAR